MPSGEALSRQMIYGQRFFESRFGIRCDTAWLPDSFGLTGALPQLIRLAGMDNFFTQKLSWCAFFLSSQLLLDCWIVDDNVLMRILRMQEQHQCISAFHIQLGGHRRDASLMPHDACRHVASTLSHSSFKQPPHTRVLSRHVYCTGHSWGCSEGYSEPQGVFFNTRRQTGGR